jgi:hypothetical protein
LGHFLNEVAEVAIEPADFIEVLTNSVRLLVGLAKALCGTLCAG